jgi:hypothetical protein
MVVSGTNLAQPTYAATTLPYLDSFVMMGGVKAADVDITDIYRQVMQISTSSISCSLTTARI